MIVLEGLILAFVGVVIGMAFRGRRSPLADRFTRVKGMIEHEVSARLMIEVLSGVIVLGCLGSLYPAWQAVRLNVVDALRYA